MKRILLSVSKSVHRYMGLSLSGAKSDKSCLTVIDFYRKQEKAFVVDIYDQINRGLTGSAADDESDNSDSFHHADKHLLDLIHETANDTQEEESPPARVLAVDVPLTLPPCLVECRSDCGGFERCKRPELKWMRNQYKKAAAIHKKVKHFTPYTQRPVDLYQRYKHLQEEPFQDETMGANLAPLTARMQYLKNRLPNLHLIEVWPKLSLFSIHKALKLNKKQCVAYRHVENGAAIREQIIERLAEKANLFVYDRDAKKLVQNVNAFDSFICAWTSLQFDLGKTQKPRADFPVTSGWVEVADL